MSEPEFREASSPRQGFTVETAKVLAEVAHNRQKDKLKRPYREHVLAVGDALADFDDEIRIAGYLHDIADNAHNSLPERVQALAAKWPDKPPVTKYRDARPVLYAAVEVEEVRKILARANPWLLEEFDAQLDDADDTDYENLRYDSGSGS